MRGFRRLAMLLALAGLLFVGCAAHRAPLPVSSPYRDPSTLEEGQILHLATGRVPSMPEKIVDAFLEQPVLLEHHRKETPQHGLGVTAVLPGTLELFSEQLFHRPCCRFPGSESSRVGVFGGNIAAWDADPA